MAERRDDKQGGEGREVFSKNEVTEQEGISQGKVEKPGADRQREYVDFNRIQYLADQLWEVKVGMEEKGLQMTEGQVAMANELAELLQQYPRFQSRKNRALHAKSAQQMLDIMYELRSVLYIEDLLGKLEHVKTEMEKSDVQMTPAQVKMADELADLLREYPNFQSKKNQLMSAQSAQKMLRDMYTMYEARKKTTETKRSEEVRPTIAKQVLENPREAVEKSASISVEKKPSAVESKSSQVQRAEPVKSAPEKPSAHLRDQAVPYRTFANQGPELNEDPNVWQAEKRRAKLASKGIGVEKDAEGIKADHERMSELLSSVKVIAENAKQGVKITNNDAAITSDLEDLLDVYPDFLGSEKATEVNDWLRIIDSHINRQKQEVALAKSETKIGELREKIQEIRERLQFNTSELDEAVKTLENFKKVVSEEQVESFEERIAKLQSDIRDFEQIIDVYLSVSSPDELAFRQDVIENAKQLDDAEVSIQAEIDEMQKFPAANMKVEELVLQLQGLQNEREMLLAESVIAAKNGDDSFFDKLASLIERMQQLEEKVKEERDMFENMSSGEASRLYYQNQFSPLQRTFNELAVALSGFAQLVPGKVLKPVAEFGRRFFPLQKRLADLNRLQTSEEVAREGGDIIQNAEVIIGEMQGEVKDLEPLAQEAKIVRLAESLADEKNRVGAALAQVREQVLKLKDLVSLAPSEERTRFGALIKKLEEVGNLYNDSIGRNDLADAELVALGAMAEQIATLQAESGKMSEKVWSELQREVSLRKREIQASAEEAIRKIKAYQKTRGEELDQHDRDLMSTLTAQAGQVQKRLASVILVPGSEAHFYQEIQQSLEAIRVDAAEYAKQASDLATLREKRESEQADAIVSEMEHIGRQIKNIPTFLEVEITRVESDDLRREVGTKMLEWSGRVDNLLTKAKFVRRDVPRELVAKHKEQLLALEELRQAIEREVAEYVSRIERTRYAEGVRKVVEIAEQADKVLREFEADIVHLTTFEVRENAHHSLQEMQRHYAQIAELRDMTVTKDNVSLNEGAVALESLVRNFEKLVATEREAVFQAEKLYTEEESRRIAQEVGVLQETFTRLYEDFINTTGRIRAFEVDPLLQKELLSWQKQGDALKFGLDTLAGESLRSVYEKGPGFVLELERLVQIVHEKEREQVENERARQELQAELEAQHSFVVAREQFDNEVRNYRRKIHAIRSEFFRNNVENELQDLLRNLEDQLGKTKEWGLRQVILQRFEAQLPAFLERIKDAHDSARLEKEAGLEFENTSDIEQGVIPESIMFEMLASTGLVVEIAKAIVRGDAAEAQVAAVSLVDAMPLKLQERLSAEYPGGLEAFIAFWREHGAQKAVALVEVYAEREMRMQVREAAGVVDSLLEAYHKNKALVKGVMAHGAAGIALSVTIGSVMASGFSVMAAGATMGVVLAGYSKLIKYLKKRSGEQGGTAFEAGTLDTEAINRIIDGVKGKTDVIAAHISDFTRLAQRGVDTSSISVDEIIAETQRRLELEERAEEMQEVACERLVRGLAERRRHHGVVEARLKRVENKSGFLRFADKVTRSVQVVRSGEFLKTNGNVNPGARDTYSTSENIMREGFNLMGPALVGYTGALAGRMPVIGEVYRTVLTGSMLGRTGLDFGLKFNRAGWREKVQTEYMDKASGELAQWVARESDVDAFSYTNWADVMEVLAQTSALMHIEGFLGNKAAKTALTGKRAFDFYKLEKMLFEKSGIDEVQLEEEYQRLIERSIETYLEKLGKESGQTRTVIGLVTGVVSGAVLGFVGAEMAHAHQEHRLEDQLKAVFENNHVSESIEAKVASSLAAPGHENVHTIKDLTLGELQQVMNPDGKTLNLDLVRLKINEASLFERVVAEKQRLVEQYGISVAFESEAKAPVSSAEAVNNLENQRVALDEINRNVNTFENAGLHKEAMQKVFAESGAGNVELRTLNNLLEGAEKNHTSGALVRMLNHELRQPGAEVHQVLESALLTKAKFELWELSGIRPATIDKLVLPDGSVNSVQMEKISQLVASFNMPEFRAVQGIVVRVLNNELSSPQASVDLAVEKAEDITLKTVSWVKMGVSAEAVKALDLQSGHNLPAVYDKMDRLLQVASGGDRNDVLRVINTTLSDGKGTVDDVLESVMVGKGRASNSITALVTRQLENNPERFYHAQEYGGKELNFSNQAEIHAWAQQKAAQLAIEQGYINADGSSHTGLLLDAKNGSAVFLAEDASGGLRIETVAKTYAMDTMAVGERHIAETISETGARLTSDGELLRSLQGVEIGGSARDALVQSTSSYTGPVLEASAADKQWFNDQQKAAAQAQSERLADQARLNSIAAEGWSEKAAQVINARARGPLEAVRAGVAEENLRQAYGSNKAGMDALSSAIIAYRGDTVRLWNDLGDIKKFAADNLNSRSFTAEKQLTVADKLHDLSVAVKVYKKLPEPDAELQAGLHKQIQDIATVFKQKPSTLFKTNLLTSLKYPKK